MAKNILYHTSAIEYNEGMSERAAELAEKVKDDEIKRWCRGIAKQHREHADHHREAIDKLRASRKAHKKARRKKKGSMNQNKPENQAENDTSTEANEPRPEADAQPVYADQSTGEPTDAQPVDAGVGTPEEDASA